MLESHPIKHVFFLLLWFAFGIVPPLVTRGKDERLSIGERLTNSRCFLPASSLATHTTLG
jgi:hypothetical protein